MTMEHPSHLTRPSGAMGPVPLSEARLTPDESYKSYPRLGFAEKARLIIQPSPAGDVSI